MSDDYQSIIKANLAAYPGIANDSSVVRKIDSMLRMAKDAGLDRLVANFCSNHDARDTLFEVWIACMLLANKAVNNLVYEPPNEPRPPDFRFSIDGVGFDVQVKRMHNVKNEMTKLLFKRGCGRQLSRIQKPWFINFWVSDEFERKYLNEFFSDIRSNLDSFTPSTDMTAGVQANQYVWERDGKVLVRFSFLQKNSGHPGITPGIIDDFGTVDGMLDAVDTDAIRKAVERRLKKASSTLTRDASDTQANLVIVQAEGNLWMDDDTMSDVLYGEEGIEMAMATDGTWLQRSHRRPGGLFDGKGFSRICGVILVPQKATPIDDEFTGVYFSNPMHLQSIQNHPKPFATLTFWILNEWREGNPWQSTH